MNWKNHFANYNYVKLGAVHKVRHATRGSLRSLRIILNQTLEFLDKGGKGVKNWPKLRYVLYGWLPDR
jgi:hypothetical protein